MGRASAGSMPAHRVSPAARSATRPQSACPTPFPAWSPGKPAARRIWSSGLACPRQPFIPETAFDDGLHLRTVIALLQDLIADPRHRFILRCKNLPLVPGLTRTESGFEEPLSLKRRVRIMRAFEPNEHCYELVGEKDEQAVLTAASSVDGHRLQADAWFHRFHHAFLSTGARMSRHGLAVCVFV